MTKHCHVVSKMHSIFLAHSPITYSISLAAMRRLGLAGAHLIGARGVAGPKVDRALEDDGEWSIEGTCGALQCIADLAGPTGDIALYLPHTAFLLGKLIKLSARIRHYFYLEEGFTSAYAPFITQTMGPTPVDVVRLIGELRRHDLIARLQLDAAALARLNGIAEHAFDAGHPKYGGAFACSHNAFPDMGGVTRLLLQPDSLVKPAVVLVAFGIRNRYGNGPAVRDAVTQVCSLANLIRSAMRSQSASAVPLLIKLHPNDQVGLSDELYRQLRQWGANYGDFCRGMRLDANVEPALLNFQHYHVFGESAATKYIRQFCGPGRLTCHPHPPAAWISSAESIAGTAGVAAAPEPCSPLLP